MDSIAKVYILSIQRMHHRGCITEDASQRMASGTCNVYLLPFFLMFLAIRAYPGGHMSVINNNNKKIMLENNIGQLLLLAMI